MPQYQELLALYDQQERRNPTFPGTDRVVTERTVRFVDLNGGQSFLLHSDLRGLDDAALAQLIEDEIAYFTGRGTDFEWKVYSHDWPADLADRLVARGFTPDEPETLLILDLEQAPARLWADRGHQVLRLTDPAQVSDVLAVHRAVYGEDDAELGDRLRREMVDAPAELSIFVAWADGLPVGAAWIFYTPNSDFGSLFGGSVREDYRGRGVYGALLAARAREARQRGRRYLMIDAGPMSQPIVAGLGFVPVATSRPCRYALVNS